MQAVILAGGIGTRLRPLTIEIPKALVPIGGRPFIEYQIDLFRSQGITDLLLCVGYLGHLIEERLGNGQKFGVSIRYSYERDGLVGTAGAIKNAEKSLAEAFLVQYGDSYAPIDYRAVAAYFAEGDRLGLMVVYKNEDRWDRSNVIIEGGLVRVYDKKRKLPGMDYIDFGVSIFRKEAFANVPTRTPMDLSVVYQSLIESGQLLAYETSQRFYEVGSPEGLREFEALVESGFVQSATRVQR